MNNFIVSHYQVQGKRSYQEDRCFSASGEVGEYQLSLLVVADGMGGHAGGDVAAAIAIEELNDWWDSILSKPLILHWERLKDELETVFLKANKKIKRTIDEGKGAHGMGTTLICALIINGKAIIANIGDSRAYISNRERADLITKDHSAVQEALDRGIDISQSNVGYNAITRCLDGSEPCIPDLYPFEKNCYDLSNNALILCSDGLHGVLDDYSINDFITAPMPLSERLRLGTDRALEFGSTDNISIAALIPACWEESTSEIAAGFNENKNLTYQSKDKWVLVAVVILCTAFIGIAGTLAWKMNLINLIQTNESEGETVTVDDDLTASERVGEPQNNDVIDLGRTKNPSEVSSNEINYVTIKIHEVKRGDNLRAIASSHNVDYNKLIEFNYFITNPDILNIEDKIFVPLNYHDDDDPHSFSSIYEKHADSLQNLNSRIGNLNSRINSLNTKLNRIDDLKSKVDSLQKNRIEIDKKNTKIDFIIGEDGNITVLFSPYISYAIIGKLYKNKNCNEQYGEVEVSSSSVVLNDLLNDFENLPDKLYYGVEVINSGIEKIFCEEIPLQSQQHEQEVQTDQ